MSPFSSFPPNLRIASIAVLLCLVLSSCAFSTAEAPVEINPSSPNSKISLFFSQPDNPASQSLRGGPDVALAEAIDNARLSVDVAALNLDLWSLRDALIAAHRRGVLVRFVTDSDYLDTPEIQELVEEGISVLGDRREGLMHHKFILIDRQEVWTGSMNFTLNGFYRNDNNLIRIQSELLGQNYLREFEEMYVQDRFGDDSRKDTPYPEINLEVVRLKSYFSPDDGVEDHLLALINDAQEQVDILAYAFTLDSLAEALIKGSQRGLQIRGVFDEGQARSNQGGDYERLVEAGLDIRLDGNPNRMHHKVLIIDQAIVVLGSYNFSNSAETRNDENVLIIYDPEIAALVLEEFDRVFQSAKMD